MYGKKNVIEAMLEGETEEMKDVMRSELANMDEVEFNDMAKQAGFDRVGNHWVGAKIPSLESVQTTKKEGEKVAKEEEKGLPLEEKPMETRIKPNSIEFIRSKTNFVLDTEGYINAAIPRVPSLIELGLPDDAVTISYIDRDLS